MLSVIGCSEGWIQFSDVLSKYKSSFLNACLEIILKHVTFLDNSYVVAATEEDW